MQLSWMPVKRDSVGPTDYAILWWETVLIALAEFAEGLVNLLLLPFGFVVRWGWCALDWAIKRATRRRDSALREAFRRIAPTMKQSVVEVMHDLNTTMLEASGNVRTFWKLMRASGVIEEGGHATDA